jgi:hypothetical protein
MFSLATIKLVLLAVILMTYLGFRLLVAETVALTGDNRRIESAWQTRPACYQVNDRINATVVRYVNAPQEVAPCATAQ